MSPNDAAGEGGEMRMTPMAKSQIKLDPYPFDVQPLSLGFAFRHLPTHDFPSQEAFRLAYFATAPELKTFEFI